MLPLSSFRCSRALPICALALLSLASRAHAECHATHDGLDYDLSGLDGEHVVTRSREMPPTVMTDTITFNLCAELQWQGDIATHDQCPHGTSACLTTVNSKEVDGSPQRVVSVVPVAQTSNDPTFKSLTSEKGLKVTRKGATYPKKDSKEQTFIVDLVCDPEVEDSPEFVSYDGETALVRWKHKYACPYKAGEDEPPQHNEPSESAGSSLGWFFLVLIIAFVAYFGLGAYYNYATYGATGFDLIPHRDFWREVPYMLQDVFGHLCSSIRPRHSSNRGGYIAV